MKLRSLLVSGLLAQTYLSGCASTPPTGMGAWEQTYQRASKRHAEAAEAAFLAGKAEDAVALSLAQLKDPSKLSLEQHFRFTYVLLLASELVGQPELALPALEGALALALEGDAPEHATRLIPHAVKAWARLDGQSVRSERLKQVLSQVQARKGELRWAEATALSARELITAARLSGGALAASQAAKEAGFLQQWRTSAPWAEGTWAAFANLQGPESRALATQEAQAVRGVGRLAPWTNEERFSDGEVLFFDLPSEGGLGFAQAEIELSGQGHLWLESNRLVKVYLEGSTEPLLSRTTLQSPWLQSVPLQGQGKRRVTVAFFSPAGGGFFRLQVLKDLKGPALAPSDEVSSSSARLVLDLLELDRLAARPRWDFERASQKWQDLQASLGGHPWLELLGARLAQGDSQAADSEKRERARKHYQKVLAQGPNLAAWRGLARLEQDEQRFDAALALLREALSAFPHDIRTSLELLNLYVDRGWEVEALALVDTLRAQAGISVRVGQELIAALRSFGRLDEALSLAQEVNAAFPGLGQERLNTLLRERGEWQPESWEALFEAEPQRHNLLRPAVEGYRAQGRYDKALALVHQHLKYRPADGWALGERVRIALEQGQKAQAKQWIEEALTLHPDFAPLESLGLMLSNTPERFDELEPIEAILKRFHSSASVKAKAFASYPLVTVLERTKVDVAADGSVLEMRHRVRLVQSKQGIDLVGDLLPPEGARLIRTRTIKVDGRILEPERTPGKAELSFPELEPGDAVETAWVTRSQVQAREGGYLTGISFAQLGTPTAYQDVTLRAHPSLALKLTRFGNPPAPQTFEDASATSLHWELKDRMPVGRESFSISPRSFFPFVDVRVEAKATASPELPNMGPLGGACEGKGCEGQLLPVAPAWRWIAGEYASQLTRLLQPGPRTKATAATLKKEANPTLAAYRFVMRDINPFEELNTFQTALETALSARRGNRALVLTGLLRELSPQGEAVNLVLCSPERDGTPEDKPSPTPNANRFSYPLVELKGGAGVRYFDVARPFAEMGALPRELNGAQCLDIEGGRFFDLPKTPSTPTFKLSFDIRLDEQGNAKVKVEGQAQGANAAYIRQAYANLDDERRHLFFEQWLQTLLGDLTLASYEVKDADDLVLPMRFTLEAEVNRYANPEDGALHLSQLLPVSSTGDLTGVPDPKRFFALAERKTPLRLLPLHEEITLNLSWPESFSIERLPQEVESSPLKQRVQAKDQQLMVSRILHLEPGRVNPEAYPALRDEMGRGMRVFESGMVLKRR